tara:strand:+ start:185 stop:925 length:741 start_codon:yes stop_codon:yes gene_type:complete
MSLKNIFFKNKLTYKIYLYYNLYVRHKGYKKRSSYSQWGEDHFIENFFKNKKTGVYFDVGCFHPFKYSNTCLLFNKGWKGINIDANPTSIDLFKIARPQDINLCTAIDEQRSEFKFYFDHPFSPVNTLDKQSYENFKDSYYRKWKKKSFVGDVVKIVKSKTIDEILAISKPYTKIDFLNIDIEGMDFTVLKQLVPKKINPKLISIETHSTENTKLRDCDQIYDFLKNSNYVVLDRAGQSTLFKLND